MPLPKNSSSVPPQRPGRSSAGVPQRRPVPSDNDAALEELPDLNFDSDLPTGEGSSTLQSRASSLPRRPAAPKMEEEDLDPFSKDDGDDDLSAPIVFEDEPSFVEGKGNSEQGPFEHFNRDEKEFNVSMEVLEKMHEGFKENAPRSANDQAALEKKRQERDNRQIKGHEKLLKASSESLEVSSDVRKKDENGADLFIDEKNKKLKPIGGTEIRDYRYDDRVNREKKQKLLRNFVLGGVALLVGLSAMDALIPDKTLSEDEVKSIYAEQAGDTGFPIDQGGAFAAQFVEAYVTTDDDNAAQLLSSYYSGQAAKSGSGAVTRSVGTNVVQTALTGAQVYQSTALTPNSANYVVGINVEANSKEAIQPAPSSSAQPTPSPSSTIKPESKREFFSVNVFYDVATNTYSIAEGSPTLTAPVHIASPAKNPVALPVGTGQENPEVAQAARATIDGFIKGYAESTTDNYTTLEQYITPDAPATVRTGMGGEYTPQQESIPFKLYDTDTEGVYKAIANVRWVKSLQENPGGNDSTAISYDSTYVVTLNTTSEGKYSVSDFRPYLYLPDNTTQN